MRIMKVVSALLFGLAAIGASAQNNQEAAIKKLIEQRVTDGGKIESVTKTPYAGLYEVRIGNDILYTDSTAKYLFVGRIIDTETMKDYTKDRVDEVSRIKFSDLPLESALKMVKGNGKRVIAVFEDPNCGYCKRFRQTLNGMDNITVYTFMYNILSEDSAVKSRNIWCSPNRSKAWDEWMINGREAPAASKSCTDPNQKIFALGRKLNITGTPTVFFADGSRIPGAVDAKMLENKLASIK
jgi:thiol:disulfide interchange protein DsbC